MIGSLINQLCLKRFKFSTRYLFLRLDIRFLELLLFLDFLELLRLDILFFELFLELLLELLLFLELRFLDLLFLEAAFVFLKWFAINDLMLSSNSWIFAPDLTTSL